MFCFVFKLKCTAFLSRTDRRIRVKENKTQKTYNVVFCYYVCLCSIYHVKLLMICVFLSLFPQLPSVD